MDGIEAMYIAEGFSANTLGADVLTPCAYFAIAVAGLRHR